MRVWTSIYTKPPTTKARTFFHQYLSLHYSSTTTSFCAQNKTIDSLLTPLSKPNEMRPSLLIIAIATAVNAAPIATSVSSFFHLRFSPFAVNLVPNICHHRHPPPHLTYDNLAISSAPTIISTCPPTATPRKRLREIKASLRIYWG